PERGGIGLRVPQHGEFVGDEWVIHGQQTQARNLSGVLPGSRPGWSAGASVPWPCGVATGQGGKMPEGNVDEPAGSDVDDPLHLDEPITDAARLRQRAVFLRELAEARALLARTTPWRTRSARLRERMRQSSYHL